ncbi:hypothetical protein M0R45_021287 [Rubus argutus]|uniref:CCHC-type domain-containing protein n=1 Tax=Rubus argutus TaxID=59490 RepID=A0AAW1XAW5_RUBAR
MNVKNAQLIGSEIGVLLETDDPTKVDAALRGYLRVKVAIDSRKPLPTGFWRPLSDTTKRRVYYSYEGLCHFCFTCGRLGHLEDACRKCKSSDPPELQQERSWYGPWMAVDAPKSPHSNSDHLTRVNRKKPQSFRSTRRESSGPYNSQRSVHLSPSHNVRTTTLVEEASDSLVHATVNAVRPIMVTNFKISHPLVCAPCRPCLSFDDLPPTNLTKPYLGPRSNWFGLDTTTSATHTKGIQKLSPLAKANPNPTKPNSFAGPITFKPTTSLTLTELPNPSPSNLTIVDHPVSSIAREPITSSSSRDKEKGILVSPHSPKKLNSYRRRKPLFHNSLKCGTTISSPSTVSIPSTPNTPIFPTFETKTRKSTSKRLISETNFEPSCRYTKARLLLSAETTDLSNEYVAIPSNVVKRGGRGRGRGGRRGGGQRNGRSGTGAGRRGRGSATKVQNVESYHVTDLNLGTAEVVMGGIMEDSTRSTVPKACELFSMEGQSPLQGCGGWPGAATSHQ